MHRDLKPANILINSDCKIKICDFGMAKPEFINGGDQPNNSCNVTTRWYRAPELLLGITDYNE